MENNYYNPPIPLNPPIRQTIIINPNFANPRINMKRKFELPAINQPEVGDSTFFTGISKPAFNKNSAMDSYQISKPSQESVNADWANEFVNRCNERKNEYGLKLQQQQNQIAKPHQGPNHLLH